MGHAVLRVLTDRIRSFSINFSLNDHSLSAKESEMLVVYTTVGEEGAAKRVAETVIRAQLAACAQISRIESLYLWAGDMQQTPEWRIAFKTTEACYDAITTVLKADHPYELPQIIAVPVCAAHPEYALWVDSKSIAPAKPGAANRT
jgi:periplasmic divalent cation tolerance protein